MVPFFVADGWSQPEIYQVEQICVLVPHENIFQLNVVVNVVELMLAPEAFYELGDQLEACRRTQIS